MTNNNSTTCRSCSSSIVQASGKNKEKDERERERERERNEGKRALKSLTRQYSINRLDERLLMRMRTTVIIIIMMLPLWFFSEKMEKKQANEEQTYVWEVGIDATRSSWLIFLGIIYALSVLILSFFLVPILSTEGRTR